MNALLLGDGRDVVRKRRKIEYPHVMVMRGTIKCYCGTAGTGSENCDFHCLSAPVVVRLWAP
jgi:hypothetical protein